MIIREMTIDDAEERLLPMVDEIRSALEPEATEPLQISTGIYRQLDEMGLLTITGAFSGEKLAGIAVMMLQPHPHYPTRIVAINDVLYLRPEHRRGTTGIQLMRFAIDAARSKGATMIEWHVKPGSSLEFIARRMGAEHRESVYFTYITNSTA